jgi:hypothetical protein
MSTKCNNLILKNCNKKNIEYNKLNTNGNDPSISKAQRLSQYLNSVNFKIHYENSQAYLDNRGLIFIPQVKDSVINQQNFFIDNNTIYSRVKIFL